MGQTARAQILAAVDGVISGPGDTFTVRQIVDELLASGTNLAPATIRTHISSRMCADAPDHHGTTYDDLERVSRGVYRRRSRR